LVIETFNEDAKEYGHLSYRDGPKRKKRKTDSLCKDHVPTTTSEQQFNDVKALLSEDDQSLVDTDDIGLPYDAEVSDLPPHIQSKIFSVVSQTSRAHLALSITFRELKVSLMM
jgi:hypothetical protein